MGKGLRSDPVRVAAGHLAAGRVVEAAAIYERVLRDQPANPRALCGLGAIAMRNGDMARAFDLVGHAVSVAPDDALAVGNLAVVYQARREFDAAQDCFRRALDLDSGIADLHSNYATLLLARGHGDLAAQAQEYAIALDPGSAILRFNLANILSLAGREEEAAAVYGDALALDPDHVGALNNLAQIRKRQGRLDDARLLLDEALLRDPMNPELMANDADLLLQQGRRDEALERMRRAARLVPKNPRLQAALGTLLLETGNLAEAGRELAAATRGDPNDPGIPLALACLMRRQGRLDAALTAAERAVSLQKGLGSADLPLAELLLMLCRYDEAWPRLAELAQRSPRPYSEPDLGPGADLHGADLRLIATDAATSLFAARFLPHLAARGASPSIVCPPPLARLMATVPGVCKVVSAASVEIPAASSDDPSIAFLDDLPRLIRATPQTVERQGPAFAVELPAGSRRGNSGVRRVGIWWEGPGPGDALPLALTGVGGVRLVSLQNGAAGAAKPPTPTGSDVENPGASIVDYLDLAAAILDVDLMIAPDGPVAHLAAGLGVETWVLVDRDGSWYWPLAEGLPSPWYPTSRSFRQSPDGTWSTALERLVAALESGFTVGSGSATAGRDP